MALADDLATRSQTLGQTLIANLSQWYEGGVFYQSSMSNYHLAGFPHAALMATLARYTTNATLKANYIKMIGEVVEFGIATNMNAAQNYFADGAVDPFGWYGQFPDAEAANLGFVYGANPTIEQIANLGWILWQLPDGAIPSATRRRWLKVCDDTCTALDTRPSNSITTYFINGNYQCHLLGTYWFTAMASAGARRLYFQDCYERAYNFMVKPYLYQPVSFPSPWGLTIDVAGSGYDDWGDTQIHITETNTRGANPTPDWDPYYSQLQADCLARVFLANRDTRLIRIINGITNKNAVRWNRAAHTLDGSGGSRSSGSGYGYQNAYFEVQALMGAKSVGTLDLTQAESLARWDGATIPNMTGNSTNGQYGAATARQLALCVGSVRAASGIVAASTQTAA